MQLKCEFFSGESEWKIGERKDELYSPTLTVNWNPMEDERECREKSKTTSKLVMKSTGQVDNVFKLEFRFASF